MEGRDRVIAWRLTVGNAAERPGRGLKCQNQPESIVKLHHHAGWHCANALPELLTIDGAHLRDIRYRIAVESRIVRGKNYVTGMPGIIEVGVDGHYDNRVDARTIKSLRRDDHPWPLIAERRADGNTKIQPPDLATADHLPLSAVRFQFAPQPGKIVP